MSKKVPFKNKFDTAKRYSKISTCLLYTSTILLIINFTLGYITDFPSTIIRCIEIINCLVIILFSVFEFVVNYTYFDAESHRREDFVDNSFASLIAENRTDGYYSNDNLKSGLYKMGVNNFESCFFSYYIAKKDLFCLWSKTILISLIFIAIAICGYDKWLIFIIQLSIPVVLLQQSIKHTLFVSRLKNVLGRYRSLFNSLKKDKNKKNDSEIIRDILEYEATIAWGNILLDEKTYNKMNVTLSDEWENLKKEYSIQ
ncbi:MAG: hypothetical protein LBC68_05400 [Prevotellaceae bacterium]|jgi:hypothetical protein|nr:hypothetical protein [Prevotellaceae bacterium]